MGYKTILVHVDDSAHANQRIALAARMAMQQNGHLIGAALTGISRFIKDTVTVDPNDPDVMPFLNTLRERAKKSLEGFSGTAQKIGDLSCETRLIDDDAPTGLSLSARYADLLILGQFDPDDNAMSGLERLPETVAMSSGCPVLMVPYANTVKQPGERVLVAWNASLEARQAVHYALPLLQQAKIVEVIIFNPVNQQKRYGDQPGADLAVFLGRHGVKVDVMQETTDADVGDALLSLAANLSSDLLVMGCYGHSRFREVMLGGATRTILGSATIPVLMAH